MCSMNNNAYEHTKSLLSLFMEFFFTMLIHLQKEVGKYGEGEEKKLSK